MGETWTVHTVLDCMERHGSRTAVVALSEAGDERRSHSEIAASARALASGLRAAGARAGEHAYLVGANGLDWITAYLGAMAAGLLVAPFDHLTPAEEIARNASAAPPGWVFADRAHLDALRPVAPEGRSFCIGEAGDADAPSWHTLTDVELAVLPDLDPTAPCLLLQTSGTTGAPKLFRLTARNLGANIVPLVEAGLARPDDRLVLPLPLHHVYPQVVGLLSVLHLGATLVLPAGLTGPVLLSALQTTRATGIIAVPRLYEALVDGLEDAIRRRSRLAFAPYRAALGAATALRRRLGWNLGNVLFSGIRARLSPELRLLVSGGAPLDPAIAWTLAGLGFDVRSGYGLAETASTHTANVPGIDRIGTEGQPFQGGEVRIDAPDEEGIGEILLRGPNVFDGYLDPALNAGAFTEDGWFRTGDLGRLDQGFLTVTGRVKETLVLGGGKKVNPETLEKIYGASPFIAEIALLERDGRLVALVRADATALTEAGLIHAEGAVRVALADVARTRPTHEQPSGFALVREAMPRTRLGKLRRFLLPEIYDRARQGFAAARAASATVDDRALRDPRAAAAWRLLQERYAERLTGVDDHLALDLGVDSLEWINLSLALEQRLRIDLKSVNLSEIVTVRGLLEAVAHAPAGAGAATPEAAEPWLRPALPWQRAVGRLVLGLDRLLARTLFRLRATGTKHLPREGPFVVVCNHLSYLDAPMMAAALPWVILRRTHWGAAEHTLPAPEMLHWLYVAMNVFPLEEAASAVGLACARAALESGDGVVFYPEAWRSPDGRLQPFMPGIGLMVGGTEIPVVPACIKGTFEALPRHRRWPRLVSVRLRFGPPWSPAELDERGTGETPEQRIADGLHQVVAELCAGADR